MILESNMQFGRNYRLLEHLDTGAFAEVWRAHHLISDSVVALKIFPHIEKAERASMMHELAPDLRHDHLLTAVHVDLSDDGRLFLVMPYCKGGNMTQKIGRLSEHEAAYFVHQVAGALDYLHQKNLTHGDIKPNNCLVGEKRQYFLADLGLSRRARATVRKSLHYNHSGANIKRRRSKDSSPGITPPPYRAPELSENNGQNEGIKATDIWAFGATLHELLTGKLPFGDFGGLMLHNPGNKAANLSEKFSGDLDLVVRACLLKNTADRPTAAQLHQWAARHLKSGQDKGNWLTEEERHFWKERLSDADGGTPTVPLPKSAPAKPINIPWRRVGMAAAALLLIIFTAMKIVEPQQDPNLPPSSDPKRDTFQAQPPVPFLPDSTIDDKEKSSVPSGNGSKVSIPPPRDAKINPPAPTIHVPDPPVSYRSVANYDICDDSTPAVITGRATDKETVLTLSLTNHFGKEVGYNVYATGRNAFRIVLKDGTKLLLKKASGDIGENIIKPAGGRLQFTLYFDALPPGTTAFKLIENGAGPGNWCYTVRLR